MERDEESLVQSEGLMGRLLKMLNCIFVRVFLKVDAVLSCT